MKMVALGVTRKMAKIGCIGVKVLRELLKMPISTLLLVTLVTLVLALWCTCRYRLIGCRNMGGVCK